MSNEAEVNAVSQILRETQNPVIVDLGSYDGADAQWMANVVGNRPRTIIMLEPDKENFYRVREVAKSIGAEAFYGAISDHTGSCDFWACYTPEGRGSGSIRKPTGHLEEKPWYDFRKLDLQIPCLTLDDIFEMRNLDHIDMLWVDVQGAENLMIAGGQKALARTRFMFIEAEKRILYDGQSIREDLLAMLPGWSIVGDFDYNLLLRQS